MSSLGFMKASFVPAVAKKVLSCPSLAREGMSLFSMCYFPCGVLGWVCWRALGCLGR